MGSGGGRRGGRRRDGGKGKGRERERETNLGKEIENGFHLAESEYDEEEASEDEVCPISAMYQSKLEMKELLGEKKRE